MATSRESELVDHYRILGVDSAASAADIAAAYRVQARRHHPDVAAGGDGQEFHRLQTAYEVLADPTRRAEYDRARRRAASGLDPSPSSRGVRIPVHRRESATEPRTISGDEMTGDFRVKVTCGFPQAALGGTVAVTDPQGEIVHLRIPPGTPANTTLRAVGHGATVGGRRGDLYVTLHIDVPRALTDEQRRLLEAFAATLDARIGSAAERKECHP